MEANALQIVASLAGVVFATLDVSTWYIDLSLCLIKKCCLCSSLLYVRPVKKIYIRIALANSLAARL